MIAATRRYIDDLIRCIDQPELRRIELRAFIAEQLAAGSLTYFAPYEAVHSQNVERVVAALAGPGTGP
jgi:hypothetical protein